MRFAMIVAACVVPALLGAQGNPATRTLRVEKEYAQPFVSIFSVRELRDGRVIVSDPRDRTVQAVDIERGAAVPVGRSGSGPLEWLAPNVFFALPGDSTLMIDAGNRREFLIGPDGAPVATKPLPTDKIGLPGTLRGSASNGQHLSVWERAATPLSGPSTGVADVIRWNRYSPAVDTLTQLNLPKGEVVAGEMLPNGQMRFSTNLPLAPQDLAVMAPDGRVAVVRAAPYRVEWYLSSGQKIVGPIANAARIAVTDEEKEAFVRSQIRPAPMRIAGPTSAPPPPKGAETTRLTVADIRAIMNAQKSWPDVKPPFPASAARVDGEGRVWVQRSRAWNDSVSVFDVFDGAGRVVERIALPNRTRLVGFGAGVAYLARTDDDDFVWLQRVRYR